jgi:hypothetical protein
MPVIPINYVAVLVAGAANFVLGFLWFGPIFGKIWISLMGITQKQIDEAKKKSMAGQLAISFIASVVTAFVLEHSIIFASDYLGIYGVAAGLQGGFWNWLGFVVPVTLSSVLWEGKSWKLWILTSGYYLVGLLIMGVILATWM